MQRRARRHGGEDGFTLMEVIISVLLIGLMSSMCLPVFLTGRMSAGRINRRAAAADCVQRLSKELASYVTADVSLSVGPGTGADGWYLPGDTSGLRALEPGVHPLDPARWAGPLAPYSGQVSYTVSVRQTPSGPQPDVAFAVDWSEP